MHGIFYRNCFCRKNFHGRECPKRVFCLGVKEIFKSRYDVMLGKYSYPYYVVKTDDGTEGIISGIYLTEN